MREFVLAAAAVVLLLAGCGQGVRGDAGSAADAGGAGAGGSAAEQAVDPDNGRKDGNSGHADEAGDTDDHADSGAGHADNAADEAKHAADDADGGADAGLNDMEERNAPKYKMNKAYRFEPLDPAADDPHVVLLTFDDGPKERDMLEQMLDALDRHKAKAVFFVNGYRAERQPELLELIRDRGHMIGNHSWDHIDLKAEDEDTVRGQIGRVQQLVEEVTGEAPKLFRPPFGSGGDSVRGIAEQFGLLYMTWSNGSLDWDASVKNKPEAVIENVLDQLHPGANILMHELPWTADALDRLLEQIKEAGYGFLDPFLIETPDVPVADAGAGGA